MINSTGKNTILLKGFIMTEKQFFKTGIYFTIIVTVGIWSLLIWNHFNGGVPAHHILNRDNLPEISNWWGGLILPALTLFLVYRIQKRLIHNKSTSLISISYGFFFALLFGILLSLFYTIGHSNISSGMMKGLFLLALFFPVYRAECLLGFVIGMTFTFGAVLPTITGCILVLAGAVIYLYVRTGIIFIIKKLFPLNNNGINQ